MGEKMTMMTNEAWMGKVKQTATRQGRWDQREDSRVKKQEAYQRMKKILKNGSEGGSYVKDNWYM